MTRKPTPDILGSLMGKPIKPESNKKIKQVSHKTIKEKATFNLSKDIVQQLEECWMEIRRLRGDKKASKTDLVECGIEEIIKDFKARKKESHIYGFIENKNESRE